MKKKNEESNSGNRETIEEFFARLGIPIRNVTEEMERKTHIFGIPRPPTKEKDASPDVKGE